MKKNSKDQIKKAKTSFNKAREGLSNIAIGTVKTAINTAKGIYETVDAGDIAIYNKTKQKLGESTTKVISLVQKNLLTALISTILLIGGGNAVYNKIQDKKENKIETVTAEKGDYLIKIIIGSVDLTEEEMEDYSLIRELILIVAETNDIPENEVDNIEIGQKIKIDHSKIKKARKKNKKKGKEEIGGGDNTETYNITEKPIERFKKEYNYFDNKNELLGKKRLIDIYKNYENNKFNFQKVELKLSKKHELIDIGKIEDIILHSTGANPYLPENIGTIPAQIYIDTVGKVYLLGKWGNGIFSLKGINHAGVSKRGNKDKIYFKKHSIGIEVSAKANENRTNKQYKAVEQVLYRIAINYNKNLKASDVLTHTQIAYNEQNGRGRKTDPYYVDWSKLGLPNNYYLIDYNVANGEIPANHEKYKRQVKKHLPSDGNLNEIVYSNENSDNIRIAIGVEKAKKNKETK